MWIIKRHQWNGKNLKPQNFPFDIRCRKWSLMNKQGNYQNFKKKLCELDKWRLTNLEKFDFSKHTSEQIENTLHAFVMDPTDTACKEKHRFDLVAVIYHIAIMLMAESMYVWIIWFMIYWITSVSYFHLASHMTRHLKIWWMN